MLSILLLILKILGILLLVLLSLILLCVLLILFVPIRYQLQAEKWDSIKAAADVTWLFHLLHVHVSFENKKLNYYVKISFKKLLQSKTEENDKEKGNTQTELYEVEKPVQTDQPVPEKEAEQTEVTPPALDSPKEEEIVPVDSQPDKETAPQIEELTDTEKSTDTEKNTNTEKSTDTEKTIDAEEKPSIKQRLLSIKEKITGFFTRTEESIQNIQKKIEGIQKKIDLAKRFLTNKVTTAAWKHLKKEVVFLLKHYLPKKAEGHLHIGFEDPSMTGKIFGYVCAFNALMHQMLLVEPDFEQKVLEGDFKIRGHIRVCHALKSGLSLLLDRNIRKTIKRIRKLKG